MGPSAPVAAASGGRPDGRGVGGAAVAASSSCVRGRVYRPVNSSVECRISFRTILGEPPAWTAGVAHWHRRAWESKTSQSSGSP